MTEVEALVHTIDNQTKALYRVAESFDRTYQTGERLKWLMRLLLVIGLIVAYGVYSVRGEIKDTHHALVILQQATSPKAQAAANKATSTAIGAVTNCVDNHTDRVATQLLHLPVPVRLQGCSPDSLP